MEVHTDKVKMSSKAERNRKFERASELLSCLKIPDQMLTSNRNDVEQVCSVANPIKMQQDTCITPQNFSCPKINEHPESKSRLILKIENGVKEKVDVSGNSLKYALSASELKNVHPQLRSNIALKSDSSGGVNTSRSVSRNLHISKLEGTDKYYYGSKNGIQEGVNFNVRVLVEDCFRSSRMKKEIAYFSGISVKDQSSKNTSPWKEICSKDANIIKKNNSCGSDIHDEQYFESNKRQISIDDKPCIKSSSIANTSTKLMTECGSLSTISDTSQRGADKAFVKQRQRIRFRCDVCFMAFIPEDEKVFLQHLRSHPIYKYKCTQCLKAYKAVSSLYNHYNIHKGTFVCSVCDKAFPMSCALEQHEKRHKGIKEFECDICKRNFVEKKYLIKHFESHAKRPFHCKFCPVYFKEEHELSKHYNRRHAEKRYPCSGCEEEFSNKLSLAKHMATHGDYIYKCTECSEMFKNRIVFKKHKRFHIKRFMCSICSEKFRYYKDLHQHILMHTGIEPLRCGKCGKHFSQKSNLYTHMRGVHSIVKPFVCDFCNMSFKLKQSCKIHINQVHINNKVSCNSCDKVFSSKDILRKHIKNAHGSDLSVSCGICGKTVKRRNLKVHLEIHSEARLKYTCEECGNKFTSKHYLITHLNLHAGFKPYVCQKCGARFAQNTHLRTHLRLHTDNRNFRCNVCNKMFRTKCNLVTHCSLHNNNKSLKCHFCGKEFNFRTNLAYHIKSNHTDSRTWRYSCNECGKRFHDKSALRNHSSSHTDARPFQCQYCDSTYKYRSGLCDHITSSHKRSAKLPSSS